MAMTQWRALRLAEAEAEGDDREHERGAWLVCLRWLLRLSAAAVRGRRCCSAACYVQRGGRSSC